MAREEVGESGVQPRAKRGDRVPRGSIEEHIAVHIDTAIDIARGAQVDVAMLRTEIDWDRANLLQLNHLYREALKLTLTGHIKRTTRSNGSSFPGFQMRDIRPSLVELLQEVCREIDLEAESAG